VSNHTVRAGKKDAQVTNMSAKTYYVLKDNSFRSSKKVLKIRACLAAISDRKS